MIDNHNGKTGLRDLSEFPSYVVINSITNIIKLYVYKLMNTPEEPSTSIKYHHDIFVYPKGYIHFYKQLN